MDACLAYASFQFEGVVQHFPYQRISVLVLVVELLDVFDAVCQGGLVLLVLAVFPYDYRLVGNHLGQAVGLRDGQFGDACDVLYGRLGGHSAEGYHVGDMVGPVVLLDVLDDPIAAFVVEVHVDIRHRDALGVEETLEQEVVLDGVQVCDAQTVGNARSGG